MLAGANRLRTGSDFTRVVRKGRRAGSTTVVLHWLAHAADGRQHSPVKVGFVVSKGVGGAVVRNRVRRRLRHVLRDRLRSLPAGGLLVVRANAGAADAAYTALSSDVARCLRRLELLETA